MNEETAVSIVKLLELMDRIERYPADTVFCKALDFLTESLEENKIGREELRKYRNRWRTKHFHQTIGGRK